MGVRLTTVWAADRPRDAAGKPDVAKGSCSSQLATDGLWLGPRSLFYPEPSSSSCQLGPGVLASADSWLLPKVPSITPSLHGSWW